MDELEFLCLTHPHDDHYKGMSHLLRNLRIRWFWLFNGLAGDGFVKLIEFLQCDAEASDAREDRENAAEFERIFAILGDKRRETKEPLPKIVRAGTRTLLHPTPFDESAPFRIIALAPTGDLVSKYEAQIANCFEDGTIKDRYPRPDHNMVSVALVIIHGQTRVILGGDVGEDGWRDAVPQIVNHLWAHLVKVSHHGSSGSICEGLWMRHAAHGKPFAVATCYRSKNLPRRDALEEIGRHSRAILLTCGTAFNVSELPGDLSIDEFAVRLALLKKMGTLTDEAADTCGRWSFVFDDQGTCVAHESAPPAMVLSGSMT